MGAYLSEPNLNKQSVDDESETLSYGASSMQGWRIDQEDAHNAILNFDKLNGTSFFAVYDGHGGAEVAEYCAKYLPECLKNLDEYINGNLEEALRKVFLKFDESLLTPEAQKELQDLKEMNSRKTSVKEEKQQEKQETQEVEESGDEPDEDSPANEAAKLYDEATMPLEEVLKRYANMENKTKKALKKKGILKTKACGSSTTANFQEQEEIDINEIKKNSKMDENQEYDEASNLGEVSDSQKSNQVCESSSLQANDLTKQSNLASTTSAQAVNSNDSETTKLTKEEIKLSPILKKSLSSSLIIDDVSSINSETTVLNGHQENKENDNSNSQQSEEKKQEENETTPTKSSKSTVAKKKKMSNSNLIAKFIAGVVNSKLKQGLRKSAKKEDNEEDEEEEEEDDEDYEGEEDEEEENSEEAEEEEEEEEEDDEDDDDDEEDEDYEEEDDEEEEYETENGQGMGLESRPGYDSGCTAVVALLRDNKKLYVANAGDSRCVVCRDGKAIDMSFDHKPEDDSERERIEKAGGHVTKDGRVNNGLNLSRAIGDHSYKANQNLPLSEQMITSLPDLKVLDIDPKVDKFMVLACDGIWNFMSSQEVCDYIQERLNANYAKLSQICEELFMHCLAPDSEGDGTGCDNMTCIIVTFSPFKKYTIKLNAAVEAEKISLKRTQDQQVDSHAEEAASDSTSKKLRQDEAQNLDKN